MVSTANVKKVDDVDGLVAFARAEQIGLTVVGPEKPLTMGIVDAFEANGLHAWGPREAAARLEGSKAFAKEVMAAAGMPTAGYWSGTDAEAAKAGAVAHLIRTAAQPAGQAKARAKRASVSLDSQEKKEWEREVARSRPYLQRLQP